MKDWGCWLGLAGLQNDIRCTPSSAVVIREVSNFIRARVFEAMSDPLCPPNLVSALVARRASAGGRWLLPAEADRQRRPRSPAPSVLTPTLAASWEPMVCTGTARPTVGGRDSPQAGTRKRGRSLLPRGPTSTNRRQRRRRSRGAGRLRAGMWNTGGQSAPGRAPGCPELRPASAKAAAARTALASHTGLVSPTGVPSAAGHTVLRR